MALDIIGDVHGHADALEALLGTLGYRISQNVWTHPDRHLIFVGDLIDRGPRQIDTVLIARRMADAGRATVVMGNHEFNAIGWATESGSQPGQFLRRHSEKNLRQHQAFLAAVGENSHLHRDIIAWFRSLPLWADRGGISVVHACWHLQSQEQLRPVLGADNTLATRIDPELFDKRTKLGLAAEILLKGLEIALPNNLTFVDANGHVRGEARIRWWNPDACTLREAAIVEDDCSLDHTDHPLDIAKHGFRSIAHPIFFGHYWLRGIPTLSSPNLACLDYSVARNGVLCAYRWDGERVLSSDKLVWV